MLKYVKKGLLGNRVSALGVSLCGIAQMIEPSPAQVTLLGVGAGLGMYTLFGLSTYFEYTQALKEGVVTRTRRNQELRRYCTLENYCAEQGLFLAAKERGLLEEFREETRTSSTLLPHF